VKKELHHVAVFYIANNDSVHFVRFFRIAIFEHSLHLLWYNSQMLVFWAKLLHRSAAYFVSHKNGVFFILCLASQPSCPSLLFCLSMCPLTGVTARFLGPCDKVLQFGSGCVSSGPLED
jgi:hypothetical protein